MRKFSMTAAFILFAAPSYAQENCSPATFCTQQSSFSVTLLEAEKRGNFVFVTTRYATSNYHVDLNFTDTAYAEIVDANGTPFSIDTRVTRSFQTKLRSAQDLSVRFEVDESFTAPFDLYITDDGHHGSLALTGINVPYSLAD